MDPRLQLLITVSVRALATPQVYGGNGSQIIAPVDKVIAAAILRNAAPWPEAAAHYATLDAAALEAALRASPLVSDPTDAAQEAYFSALAGRLCFDRAARAAPGGCPIRVAYTAMHGVGAPFAARSFAAFGLPPFDATPEQCVPDPEFPTVAFPNPGERWGRGGARRARGRPVSPLAPLPPRRGGQGGPRPRHGDGRPRRRDPHHRQ